MSGKLAKAILFKADGEIKTHYFKSERPTLSEMQTLVEGNIEFVRMPSEIMVVNEDGLNMGLPLNQSAVNYLHERNITHIPVVGDVFVLNSELIY